MRIFRGYRHCDLTEPCALTIGNFDGVHRGHQAMLALLRSEAQHRGLPVRVMTFEPHPREYFAPDRAPARIATLRDKLTELARCGVDEVVVLPFRAALARQSAEDFIGAILLEGLQVRYVLVGDDFRFGADRRGDYAMLDEAGGAMGFDVARMNSYEVHGLRVSSSAVRLALAPTCSGGPTASAATWCTAASSGASSVPALQPQATVFAPSTCAFRTHDRPPAGFLWCRSMA
jgi:riboflavin kinase/FMN adenylyltransferase